MIRQTCKTDEVIEVNYEGRVIKINKAYVGGCLGRRVKSFKDGWAELKEPYENVSSKLRKLFSSATYPENATWIEVELPPYMLSAGKDDILNNDRKPNYAFHKDDITSHFVFTIKPDKITFMLDFDYSNDNFRNDLIPEFEKLDSMLANIVLDQK